MYIVTHVHHDRLHHDMFSHAGMCIINSARFVGGLRGLTPFGVHASQPPSQNTLLTPSGFPTNRVLFIKIIYKHLSRDFYIMKIRVL